VETAVIYDVRETSHRVVRLSSFSSSRRPRRQASLGRGWRALAVRHIASVASAAAPVALPGAIDVAAQDDGGADALETDDDDDDDDDDANASEAAAADDADAAARRRVRALRDLAASEPVRAAALRGLGDAHRWSAVTVRTWLERRGAGASLGGAPARDVAAALAGVDGARLLRLCGEDDDGDDVEAAHGEGVGGAAPRRRQPGAALERAFRLPPRAAAAVARDFARARHGASRACVRAQQRFAEVTTTRRSNYGCDKDCDVNRGWRA